MVLYVFKVVNGENLCTSVYNSLDHQIRFYSWVYFVFKDYSFCFFFLIEKTFELMTLHYSILQTCFRNELDPYFHNCEFSFFFWV